MQSPPLVGRCGERPGDEPTFVDGQFWKLPERFGEPSDLSLSCCASHSAQPTLVDERVCGNCSPDRGHTLNANEVTRGP